MDGTGRVFEPLQAHLPSPMKAQVVAYPSDALLGYDALAEAVLAQLPPGPLVVLGESFSGPVAIAVAARCQPLALILVCSFAANPRPALTLTHSLLPWLPSPAHLAFAVGWVLMGRRSNAPLQTALRQALQSVTPAVLRYRAAEVLKVDARPELRELQCPVLYLQASEDAVVPKSAAQTVVQARPNARVLRLPGPHFLLQTQAAAAAQAIGAFLAELH